MRNRLVTGFLLFSMLVLGGCRASEIEKNADSDTLASSEVTSDRNLNVENEVLLEGYKIEYKEVVFKNSYAPFYVTDGLGANWIYTTYSGATDNGLYAFCVDLVYNPYSDGNKVDETLEEYRLQMYQQSSNIVVETALEMGLMVCLDYSYCAFNNEKLEESISAGTVANPILGDCVVVGTIDEIKRLFMKTPAIDGYYWELHAAPRPDWSNLMVEAGWNGIEEMHMQSAFYEKNKEKIEALKGNKSEVTLTVPVILPEETIEHN